MIPEAAIPVAVKVNLDLLSANICVSVFVCVCVCQLRSSLPMLTPECYTPESGQHGPTRAILTLGCWLQVLHPGMYSSVKSDLKVMHFMARLLETFVPSTRWLSLTECLREFGGMMMKQVLLQVMTLITGLSSLNLRPKSSPIETVSVSDRLEIRG